MQKFKKALVESFVAPITLGWVFAQAILHFAYVFAAPVVQWATRREYHNLTGSTSVSSGFQFQDALPELIRSVALLVLGYVLLRWLYFRQDKGKNTPDNAAVS